MSLWLHNQGYTFFSIPKLTYPEIKMLVNAENRKSKKESSDYKKMERKNRMKRGKHR